MKEKEEYINLIDIKKISYQLLFDNVAKVISDDTLDIVNKNDKPVRYRPVSYTHLTLPTTPYV